jgi:hypothetical protein
MEVTRSRLAKQGLPYIELGMQWDVDTPEDFMRYRQLNNEGLYSEATNSLTLTRLPARSATFWSATPTTRIWRRIVAE